MAIGAFSKLGDLLKKTVEANKAGYTPKKSTDTVSVVEKAKTVLKTKGVKLSSEQLKKEDLVNRAKAAASGSKQPQQAKPATDFVSAFAQNLVGAPGKMVEEMGNVLSGKATENIQAANKKYGEDLQSGKEKSWFKNEGATGMEAAAGIAIGEIGRGASSFLGGMAEGAGNVINTAYDFANPFMPQETKQKFRPGGALTGAGQTIKGLGSLLSNVPQESATGEASSFVGELMPVTGGSSTVSKLLNIGAKEKVVTGSLMRAKQLMAGSKLAKEGGEGARMAEEAINFWPQFTKNTLKRSVKGAADTTLATAATEGRMPTVEEAGAGILVNNTFDIFGNLFKKGGEKLYKRSIKLFSGKNESVETSAKKTREAIEEGYIGGKDPETYIQKADEKIASYSQVVQEEMQKANVTFGKEFLNGVKNKIDEIEKNLPEKAKHMRDELAKFSGDAYEKTLGDSTRKLQNAVKTLEDYKKTIADYAKKKNPPMGSIRKLEAGVRNETEQILRLQEEVADLQRVIPIVKKEGFDLFDLKKVRQIAADKNPSIVAGVTAPNAKEAAANEVWLLMRDEAENYLNQALPHLKDVNSRLNVAYRIKDALEPFMKDPTKAMKGGTRLAETLYQRGVDIQRDITKAGARKLLTGGINGVSNLAGQGMKGLAGLLEGSKEQ